MTRRRTAATLAAAIALIALALPGIASADVTAPHDILTFPQRDFVSASGYEIDHKFTVEVLHPNSLTPVGTVSGITPVEDPATPGRGTIEVNHPGGACWVGTTPDIRAGDTVRITDETTGAVDNSVVRDVTTNRPVQTAPDTVKIHGTAKDALGNPLPIAQLEQRMVAPRDAFDLNGRRTLRATSVAGSDGTLAYDPVDAVTNPNGTNWTATYTGLSAADVTRALNAEARIMWLDPAVPSTESTIYENGAGAVAGPAAPCAAPLEKLPPPPGSELIPPSTPTNLTATVTNNNTVTLNWSPSTDNVGVVDYGVYRDGIEIATVQSPDGSAPAPTTFADRNVPPGTYTYTVDAGDAVGNRSGESAGAQATTVANPAPAVTANEPPSLPVSIIAFPSRDFVSSEGFLATDTVDVSVIRDGKVITTADGQIPQDDPTTSAFDGLVEVNHPGGGCWQGVTPELRPGDVVRTTAYNPDGTVRTIDQTRTSNVTATDVTIVKAATTATSADGAVEIHGTAMAADGKPLPLDQIEERLVAGRDRFDLTGKRTLRAPGNGSMSYDTTGNPTGVKWTATYTGLTSDDVYRAAGGTSLTGKTFPGAESRILWLGANPLTGQELTIFEQGLADPPGPVAGFCSAPLEAPDSQAPTAPTGVTATQSGADVKLTWTASTDDWYVAGYRIFRDGQPIANVGGTYASSSTSAFTVATSFTDTNVTPGSHDYTVAAFDNASPQGAGATAVDKLAAGIGEPYGNLSAQSAAATQSVGDVTAPSVPSNVVATATNGDVTLNWSASSDVVGVTEYGVYRDGTLVGTVKNADGSAPAPTTFKDAAVAAGTHTYTVDAADAAGNRSAKSADATVNVTAVADTTAPSVPTGLTADTPDVHVRDIKVAWTASTDDVGVTGYSVYRRRIDPSAATQPAFAKIADVGGGTLSYTDTNVAAGTYEYTVDAVDSAGNRSDKAAAKTAVAANEPPTGTHDLIAFPARDFVSADGMAPNTTYTFSVIRAGKTVATSTPIVSDATGLAEVNHPGGACWNTVTPNIQPGDVVRITGPDGVAEQTTVSGVTAERPMVTSVDKVTGGGTVEVHGTAQDAAGKQLPIDQIEQRLVANKDSFDINGRRTLRAPGDGTIAYDSATSIRWTAKYALQTPDDLARAVGGTSTSGKVFAGAESRILWLGHNPLAANESTIYENGPGVVGGPGGVTGCTEGAAETPAPGATVAPAAGLTFQPTAVGSTTAAQKVTLTNSGSAPLHVDRAYLAGLNPGDFTITANGANGQTVAPGASVTVSVAFKPTATGTRQANLSFADDAANTTDQTVPLTGSTPVASTPTATAPVQSLAAVTDPIAVLSPLSASTMPVDLKWSGTGTSFQLQMASGASTTTLGAFTDVTLGSSSATSTRVNLAMGSTTGKAYQFRVRSCTSTVCGAWTQGPKFTLVPIDDTGIASTLFKGTWTSVSIPGTYGGTVKRSSTSANVTLVPAVTFTVSGNAAWVSTRGPDQGLAQVQVDNGTPQVVDMYAPTVQTGQIVWARDALAAGTHTVTVTVLGKKSPLNPGACNTGAKCAQVDVDMASIIK